MRCRRWAAGLALGLLFAVRPAPAAVKPDWNYLAISKIPWRNYGAQAYRAAAAGHKPLFVFVFADWCRWCQKLERETLETPRIRKWLTERYVPVAVDYDKQPKLAAALGARLVPTVVLVSPQGEKLLRFFGFLTAEDLEQTLQETLTAWQAGELPEEPIREFGSAETCCPLVPPPE